MLTEEHKAAFAELTKNATNEATEGAKSAVAEQFKALQADLEKQLSENAEAIKKANETIIKLRKQGVGESDPQKAMLAESMKLFKRQMLAQKAGNAEETKKINAEMVEKSLAKGTPTAGGFLVPTEFSRQIIRTIPKYGIARKLFRTLPMSTDSMEINALSGEPIAEMVGEGVDIAETDLAFNQVELKTSKMACYIVSTYELIDDNQSDIEIWNLVMERVAIAFAKKEDEQIFSGDGTGNNFEGFLTLAAGGANEPSLILQDKNTLNWDTLLLMTEAVDEEIADEGSFTMSKSQLNRLLMLKDDQGRYLREDAWIISSTKERSEGIAGFAWGYPIYVTKAHKRFATVVAGDRYLSFGNHRLAGVIGDKGGMRVDRFREQIGSVTLSSKDLEALRTIKRVGFKTVYGQALVFAEQV